MEVTICSYSILTNLRVHTTRLTTANCDFRILTSTRQMHNITSYLGIFENGRCDSYYRSTSKPELLACLHPSSQRRCGCCGDITAKAVGPSIYSLFSVPRMARPLPSAPSSSSATHEIRRFTDQLLGVEADEKGGGGMLSISPCTGSSSRLRCPSSHGIFGFVSFSRYSPRPPYFAVTREARSN